MNPLTNLPTSIRLKTDIFPTPQRVNASGVSESALLLSALEDYPASANVVADVTSGSPTVVTEAGVDVSSVSPGSLCSGTGFSSIPVSSIIPASSKTYCRSSSSAADPKSALYIHPDNSIEDVAVGQKVVCASWAGGTTVVATPDANPTVGMAITTTAGSATVTVTSTTGLHIGMFVISPKVPAGRFITALTATTFTLNSGTSVTAGTAIAAVMQHRLSAGFTREIRTISSSTAVICDPSGIVVGQIMKSTAWAAGYTYVTAVTLSGFTAASNATATLTEDGEFGPIVALSTAATASTTGLTAAFGAVITMGSNASSSASAATLTFTGNGNTLEDIRDGDYCVVAAPYEGTYTSTIAYYAMAYGYVRYAHRAMGQFYLYDQAEGGSPISELTLPDGVSTTFTRPTAPVSIAIVQTKDLPWPTRPFRLTGRLTALPDIAITARPFDVRATYLRGRLSAAPTLVDLDVSNYIRPKLSRITGRVPTAPDIHSIESNLDLKDEYNVRGRTSTASLVGGYLRVSATARGKVYVTSLRLLDNGEELYFADSFVRGRNPLAMLTGAETFRRSSGPVRGKIRGGASFMLVTNAMTVYDAIGSLMQLWYQLNPSTAPQDVKAKAVEVLNGSIQLIYSRARHLDYFNKSSITLTITGETNTKAIPSNVQTVLGNVRLADGNTPLWSMTTQQEITQATHTFGIEATGTPQFYFIDSAKAAEADSVQSTLWVAPTPDTDTDVKLDVAVDAPHYTWQDFDFRTPLQLPHSYAESLLLPLMRYAATSFRLFLSPEQMPQIREQYQKAMKQLGIFDPAPKQSAKPQTAEVQGTE